MARKYGRKATLGLLISPSPIDIALMAGPRGKGDWQGWDTVYSNIARAAEAMGRSNHAHLSQDHIETMADLGSGHEERMKARQFWLRDKGWI